MQVREQLGGLAVVLTRVGQEPLLITRFRVLRILGQNEIQFLAGLVAILQQQQGARTA